MAAAPGGGLREHGSWDWRQQQQAADNNDGDSASSKQYAPAASRNEAPILAVLQEQLRRTANEDDGDGNDNKCLLEIACGTGQHAAAFARPLIDQQQQLITSYLPTDLTDAAFASVRAHTAGIPGVLPPRTLDASTPAEQWFLPESPPPLPLRAILAVNLTHISPWAATLGLLRGAARHLHPCRGLLLIYGPFTRHSGQHIGEGDGNARFDASLRAQDPSWGYRDVERDVVPAAEAAGLELVDVVSMPANNLFLVFRKSGRA